MNCNKCGSDNVRIQVVNEVVTKPRHGFLWWLFIGWWWRLIWFICFGLWYILFCAIRGKKTKNVQKSVAVCQNCGNRWTVS